MAVAGYEVVRVIVFVMNMSSWSHLILYEICVPGFITSMSFIYCFVFTFLPPSTRNMDKSWEFLKGNYRMQYCSVRAKLLLLTLFRFHRFCVNAAVLLWSLSNSQLLLSRVLALYTNCRVQFGPQRQNSTSSWLLLTVFFCIPNDSLEDLPPIPAIS